MAKSKFSPEKLTLLRIRLHNSEFKNRSDKPVLRLGNKDSVDFTSQFEIGANPEKKELRVLFGILVEPKIDGKKDKELFARFNYHFYYRLENYDELIFDDNDKLIVDAHLQMNLAAIAYSSLRGLLLTRFQDTYLEGVYLPVVSPVNLFRKQREEQLSFDNE